MVGTATTFKYVFDYHLSDVYWCTADCGWITGHSYVAYGAWLPLLPPELERCHASACLPHNNNMIAVKWQQDSACITPHIAGSG